jgi:hypothetical protein
MRVTGVRENVARNILGCNRNKVTGDWRKLQSEKLHHLYTSPGIILAIKSNIIRCAGYVACMQKRRGVYRVLMGEPERKRPLVRPTHKWEDNIRIELEDIG